MSYLAAALLVGLAILIHEWGHFIASRMVKIPIRVFSIGFGPKLLSWKPGATEYRLSLIPLGGYVLPDVKDEREFFSYPVATRIAMLSGGVLANFLFAFLCFGLADCLKYGISWQTTVLIPWVQINLVTEQLVTVVPQIFSRPENMTGIVGIVAQGGEVIGGDSWNGLIFLAIISINLFFFNLLPLPVLDGGKMLLFAMEKVHPVFLRLHYPLAIAGWVIIAVMTGYVMFRDFGRYII